MKLENVYLRLEDGLEVKTNVSVTFAKNAENGVTAYYIKGSCDSLDMEFGAGIDIAIPEATAWNANFRKCEHWSNPMFGTTFETVPDQTQCFIYKTENGEFGVIVPVVSKQYKCILIGKSPELITAKLFSWCEDLTSVDALAFVHAVGSNPYTLLENCVKEALKLLGTGRKHRTERKYPDVLEYLGWCSWDSMQIRVSEEGILEKCEEFKTKNIPVKWALFDDMWAHVPNFYGKTYEDFDAMIKLMYQSSLYAFEADPIRFPNGLKSCIKKVKEYGLKVGMWHPTTGYWYGIDMTGNIGKTLGDCMIKAPNGSFIPSFEYDKAYRFYDSFHTFLKDAGADFVKIDNQSMTRKFYKGLAPVGEIASSFHDAMEDSVAKHFDVKMINCMGTASEDMWNRKASPVSRCSGDFMPENPAWFRRHITQCAFNCLIQGQFYFCDWDMWWTDDNQATKNSVLKAVSGGPVYVSDKIGRSNRDVLMPLVFEDGKLLRCDRPGTPTADCLVVNPVNSKKAFKIQNVAEKSGVIAAFNLNAAGETVTVTVSPKDVDGLFGAEFAVYEHFSKTLRILKSDESFTEELKNIDDFRLYVIVPVVDGFAAIGRTDKFISPKTIKEVNGTEVTLFEQGEYAVVENGQLIFKN